MSHKTLLATLIVCVSTLALRAEPIDENGFQKLMKEVGDTTKRFKPGIDNKDSGQIGKDAARVGELYKEMMAFWKERKADKAVKWSEESSVAATTAALAARKGDWDGVQQHVQTMMKNCKSCHEAHREKLDDGSYRIK